jgi:hypothetical protein
MRNARFGCIIFCALAATSGCRALSPDWNGTWKLNVPKSSFQDQAAITISISADGEYRYDDGFVGNTFRCDGEYRPIPIGNNRTQACVKSSATTLDRTRMENGVKTNTYHWELSAGGTILTATATAFHPSGPVIMGQVVAMRISGSNDFVGEWKDTSFLHPPSELTLRLDSQYLHISYPSVGNYVDAPLKGADAAVQGPLAPEGVTYSVQLAGRREISTLTKRDGKTFTQGYFELSDDGRVITESWWNPNRPADKSTFVYEKK